MESVRVEEIERELDVDETIFVAVGNNVDKSRRTLLWAVHSFTGNKTKKICLLHVYQPSHLLSFMHKKLGLSKFKQHAIKAIHQIERQNIQNLLNEYLFILAQEGVEADKVWMEMDRVEKGIVEIISRMNIRWLVMGAAADSEKLTRLRSKKAVFVHQQAPIFCHIWFTSNGYLVHTREAGKDVRETEILSPFFDLDSDAASLNSEFARSDSLQFLNSSDVEEEDDETERIARNLDYQSPRHSSWSTNSNVGAMESTVIPIHKEEKSEELITGETYSRLERAVVDSKDSKRRAFEEAKAMENLCVKEMSCRREMEEVLARQKLEVKTIKNQCDEYMKELMVVKEQKDALQSQLVESNNMAEELEEKIISAVELLISFKDKRDTLRTECERARAYVRGLKKAVKVDAASFCSPQILTFSFMEINEATHDFDPSWKIGEGIQGSVYRGLIRHVQVAIKMLPSYQSPLEFQNKVEVLSRVRHPHLVTLIGTCPESQSVVFEYLGNGSLEDRLSCKDNTSPLSWQTRVSVALEICSILIFLHSNKPCIVHGNLKPSNILLDDNFVSKLGDLGIFQLISQPEDKSTSSTNMPKPKTTSVYADPEYLQTGMLYPESDVYSFGIILLQMLTGRPASGIVKDVKCALERENFNSLLDSSAGDWPLEHTKLLACVALRCCENRLNRPDLVSELWYVLEPLRDECLEPTRSGPKVHCRVPSHFVCPIFQEIMKDPQIAADGFTYEADAIRGWLISGHDTSPMTNLKLEHCDLLPNNALHQAILDWQQRQ